MSRSPTARKVVKERDRCTYCEQVVAMKYRTVDHEPPRSRRQELLPLHLREPYRMLMACRDCNLFKGARTEIEFRVWLDTDEGRRWRDIRAWEIANGHHSPLRLEIPAAPGRQHIRQKRRAEKQARRRVYRGMVRHGWTDDEIRRRWPSRTGGP